MSETRVLLPPRLLSDDPYPMLVAVDQIDKAPGNVVADASKVERFGPMGTALLALAFAQRANRGAEIPRWIAPRDRNAQRFLDEIGFERFATGHGADREAGPQLGTLEMRQFTALDPVYLRQLSDFLAEHVPGTGESASFAIELCLKELLQNVFEHAESSVGCFVLPRWYQIGENVRLAVVDGGIGIPASLRRGQIQQLQRSPTPSRTTTSRSSWLSDVEVVTAAVTREGLTSRGGKRGVGLKLIRDIVTRRSGLLTIASGTARVRFGPVNKIARSRPIPFFRGTAVEVDFRPHEAVKLAREEQVF